MLTKATQKKYVAIIIIFSMMVTFYGVIPNDAQAIDAIKDASDTLTDSDVGVEADHTLDFTLNHSVENDGVVKVEMDSDFGGIDDAADITCPDSGAATREDSNDTAVCTYTSGMASGTKQIVITDVPNPSAAGSKLINVVHYNSSNEIVERVQVRVFIIDDVWMTARVDATLEFSVSGVASTTSFNGVTCTRDTTATTTDFGTLQPTVPETVCQALAVTTNADDGYIVTVEQDQELTSDSGSNINSFNDSPDGTGSTTPGVWEAPSGILDVYNTYGHMGLTSDDSDLASLGGYNDFTSTAYAGLNGSDPMVVMHHDGPSDGSTPDKGAANIAYTAEITSLQEAGDYENTLTYIATPTY